MIHATVALLKRVEGQSELDRATQQFMFLRRRVCCTNLE